MIGFWWPSRGKRHHQNERQVSSLQKSGVEGRERVSREEVEAIDMVRVPKPTLNGGGWWDRVDNSRV